MNMFGMTWEEIFALLLPGGAARRAGGWYVHGLSLRGVLVSSRDRFFKEMRLRWEWLRGISLDEFCWPGFFPVGSRVRTDCAEPLSERLIGCGRCSLRSLVPNLLLDLGAGPLREGLDQSQDLLPDARKGIMRGARPVQNLIAVHRSLLEASLREPFLGHWQGPECTGHQGEAEQRQHELPLTIRSSLVGPTQQGVPQDIEVFTQCERIDLLNTLAQFALPGL
jgi:hypothetical protein